MKQIHPIQLHILRKLLFAPVLRYSEMKPIEMENSQFVFHLDKLLEERIVRKEDEGYRLSEKGKEFANRMDDSVVSMRLQPKTTTVFCPVRLVSGEREFLLHTRLKNPFYGCQGFAAHKVWFGELLGEVVETGLFEETGLRGVGELFAIRHFRVFTASSELVEDKIMYAYRFLDVAGVLKSGDEGEFEWVRESMISAYITRPLEEFWEFFSLLTTYSGQISFKEIDQITDKF
jgi:ADP-ribose pyrophosphatase YjhB (NUDIX family)